LPELPELPKIVESPELQKLPESPELPKIVESPELQKLPESPELPKMPESQKLQKLQKLQKSPELTELAELPESKGESFPDVPAWVWADALQILASVEEILSDLPIRNQDCLQTIQTILSQTAGHQTTYKPLLKLAAFLSALPQVWPQGETQGQEPKYPNPYLSAPGQVRVSENWNWLDSFLRWLCLSTSQRKYAIACIQGLPRLWEMIQGCCCAPRYFYRFFRDFGEAGIGALIIGMARQRVADRVAVRGGASAMGTAAGSIAADIAKDSAKYTARELPNQFRPIVGAAPATGAPCCGRPHTRAGAGTKGFAPTDNGREFIAPCTKNSAKVSPDVLKAAGVDTMDTLFARMTDFYCDWQKRRLTPIMDGKFLLHYFHLSPGPLIGDILNLLEEARAEGEIQTREDAIELARQLLQEK